MSDVVLVETTPAPGPDDPRTWPLGCLLYIVGSLVINFGQIMIRLSHLAEASGKVLLIEFAIPQGADSPGRWIPATCSTQQGD